MIYWDPFVSVFHDGSLYASNSAHFESTRMDSSNALGDVHKGHVVVDEWGSALGQSNRHRHWQQKNGRFWDLADCLFFIIIINYLRHYAHKKNKLAPKYLCLTSIRPIGRAVAERHQLGMQQLAAANAMQRLPRVDNRYLHFTSTNVNTIYNLNRLHD